jgi:hypothetical protein
MEKGCFQIVEIIHRILFVFTTIAIIYDIVTLSFSYKLYIYIKYFILVIQTLSVVKLKIPYFEKVREKV